MMLAIYILQLPAYSFYYHNYNHNHNYNDDNNTTIGYIVTILYYYPFYIHTVDQLKQDTDFVNTMLCII